MSDNTGRTDDLKWVDDAPRLSAESLALIEPHPPIEERDAPLYLACQEVRAGWADSATLRHFLETEALPRYRELFDAAFGGPSVLLEGAEKLLAMPNPGAPLLAELEQLRTLATLAAGFCAENAGMEITENGRRLREPPEPERARAFWCLPPAPFLRRRNKGNLGMSIIREPRDIPNHPGFRFVGVTKDAQFVWLTVQKSADECCTLGGDMYATLESWMTVEDFKKFVLPAVEATQ